MQEGGIDYSEKHSGSRIQPDTMRVSAIMPLSITQVMPGCTPA